MGRARTGRVSGNEMDGGSEDASEPTLELYRASSGRKALVQEHRSAGSLPVSLMRVEQDAAELVVPAVPEVVVALALESDLDFRWNVGDGWAGRRSTTGDMCLIPADTDVAFEFSRDREVLLMSLPADALGKMLDRETGQRPSALEPLTGRTLFRDTETSEAIFRTWHESEHQDGAASLMIDGLTRSLVARLLRLADAREPAPTRIGRLDAAALARIEEYVDAYLAEPLTIAELAALVPLSPSRFTRSFRESTGTAPWAWVLERRVRRAARWLAHPAGSSAEGSITAIALACGFSSQSHLTRAFRARHGTTPARYRRDAAR